MVKQLPLRMWLRESANLANFVVGVNAQVVDAIGKERFIYLWGSHGVGKTHLLQAACHEATARGESSIYLPLKEKDELTPAMLEGMEQMSAVAIDDIDAIAGDQDWETALFHLYNRLRDQPEGCLLVSSSQPLAALPLKLPDLHSRLSWGLVYQLQALADEDKLTALQQGADRRGFELPDEVGQYLLRHYNRDMSVLFDLLDKLDQLSLAEQRRMTIPFVKGVIDNKVD